MCFFIYFPCSLQGGSSHPRTTEPPRWVHWSTQAAAVWILRQQIDFSLFGRLEVRGQDASKVGFILRSIL
jgi:hypothetical protein